MILCLILNEFGVFTATKSVMRMAVICAGIVGLPVTILNTVFVGAKPWIPGLYSRMFGTL